MTFPKEMLEMLQRKCQDGGNNGLEISGRASTSSSRQLCLGSVRASEAPLLGQGHHSRDRAPSWGCHSDTEWKAWNGLGGKRA